MLAVLFYGLIVHAHQLVAQDRAPQRWAQVIESGELLLAKVRGDATGGAVLDVGRPAAFDSSWTTCPSVLHRDGLHRMWYSSFYDAKAGRGAIGFATSRDGSHWQRAKGGSPVLEVGPAGALDEDQVFSPEVLHDGRRYLMWYTGAKGRHPGGIVFYRVFLATSADGVRWQRANGGRPVLDLGPPGSHDAVQVATPTVLRHGAGYRMWYAAWSPQHNHTLCVARSQDGITWLRENDGRPIVGLSPSIAFGPAIARVGDQYLLLYMALEAEQGLYAAQSRDGIYWTMLNEGRVVLAPGKAGACDDRWVGHPFVLPVSGRLRVWYTGYRSEAGGVLGWKLRIGLAEARTPVAVSKP